MLCVFPVFAGDTFLLINLLKWIKQLGGCEHHRALIVADASLPWHHAECIVHYAGQSFDEVDFITNGQAVNGWIPGSNSLWVAAAEHCKKLDVAAWCWMEPDAIPLRKDWADVLEHAFNNTVGDFLAAQYECKQPGLPAKMMSGIGVYPADAIDYFRFTNEAFDVQLSRTAIDYCTHTPLIQHFWGPTRELPPTFRMNKTNAPVNTFTLADLDPHAVVFHRSKDGTLIDLLRASIGLSFPPELMVVLPPCHKDAAAMLKALLWMWELDGQNQFDCLLSYDTTLGGSMLNQLTEAAARAFRSVSQYEYPRPRVERAPDACNVAFQHSAQHMMSRFARPWLWFEADCVPLKPSWLPMLWQEYHNCGYPVMGPIIPGMGHMNGTAIYPADFPTVSPRAMSSTTSSWDVDMTNDLVGKTHDASRIFCHRWGMVNGSLHTSQGPPAHFSSPLAVDQWIPPGAVIFHRCKDGSLIDQLRAKKYKQ